MTDPSSSSVATFTVRGGPLDRQRLEADEAVDEILIGSDVDCRLYLDLPGVSPIHARIWMDLDGVTVHDTHSPRGIYVNDTRVTGQAPLRDRDILWLGPPGDADSVMIECRFASPGSVLAPEEAAAVDAGPMADLELDAGPEPAPAPGADALADLVPGNPADDALADLVPSPQYPAKPHPDATLYHMPAPALDRAEPELEELLEPPGAAPPAAPARVMPAPARAAPPPAPEPAFEVQPPQDSGFEFFVDESGAAPAPSPPAAVPASAGAAPAPASPAPADPDSALDDLLVVDTGGTAQPSAAPPAAAPFAAEELPGVSQGAQDDIFFVDDTAAPAGPVLAPAGTEPEDGFFVEETPAVILDEPGEPVPLEDPWTPPPPAPSQPAPAAPMASTVEVRRDAIPASPMPKDTPSTVEMRRDAVKTPPAAAPARAGTPPSPPPAKKTPVAPVSAAAGAAAAGAAAGTPAPEPRRAPREPRPPASRPPSAATAAASMAARSASPARAGFPPMARYGAIAAAVVLVLGAIAFFASRSMRGPKLTALSPARIGPGQTLTLTGQDFADQAQGNTVRFDNRPGRVVKASPTEIQVEVPDVPTIAGRDSSLKVSVVVDGRESAALPLAVFQSPRIHGVSPSVAMPGEEVTLAGTGWGMGARVRFGSAEAPVVGATASSLRVRVPDAAGAPGTSLPVVVSMGADPSNSFPFLVGRLPLLTGIEPRTVSPGDVVTVAGRGFQAQPEANTVKIGGAPALVVSSSDVEVKAIVPRGAAAGAEAPIEVKVAGLDNAAQGTVTVAPPLDPVEFSFAAEPFVDAAGHEHALLTTGLGPAFVLSGTARQSAAVRAAEAQRRLNAAAVPLRATRGEDLEIRGVDSDPMVVLMGKSDPLLEVSEEDAAAYNEDWTRLGGRGGPVTRGRLALWWGAVARDLVLMLVRGESPRHAAGLAPEGKVLVDLFETARQTGRFGVPVSVVEGARPAQRDALRTIGLRVPAAVSGPPAAGGAAAPAAGGAALKLDGVWTGAETDSEGRKSVTMRFAGSTGSLAYQRALSVSVPLTGIEQRKDALHYSVKTATGTRFYVGRWDGEKVTGRIFSDAANTFPIGSFEIAPER